MKNKFVLAACAAILAATSRLSAQAPASSPSMADIDKLVDLLRKDVRAQKADILSKTLGLDASQSAAFWPVYKQYEAERQTLGDERYGIIQDFAEHYDTLNDAKAKGLMTRSFALDEKRVALEKKYMDEFLKVLPAKSVARFFQVERRVNMLIDLKVSSQIPLVN